MALRGSLTEIDVPGLIDLARQSADHAALQVQSGRAVYWVYVSRGEVVHAEGEGLSGVEALYAALACHEGAFELEKTAPPPPRHTVALPWNTLLLQALQHLDETRASTEAPLPYEEPVMAIKEKTEDVLKEMANDIEPGLRGMGVAGTDGLGIAFHKISGEVAESLGSQMALIMQLSRRSADRLEKSDVEDVLVTTSKSYLLGRFVATGYFMVVSVERDSVLGNVRLVMRNYAERLARSIPGATR
jgi:predicted regulator of Ras-like GTPase activity (Roadblock/LC7/MglB family)